LRNIYELDTGTASKLAIDPLAELTLSYTKEGLKELSDDIYRNGQLVPVVMRNGKILDGRHRRAICVDLEIGMKCVDVGDISDEDALSLVISNALNKSTNTDAAKTEAYLLCKAKGVKKSDMPSVFSRLNSNYVSKLSFIEKENSGYLKALLHQNKVRLYNREFDKIEDYGTINGIWKTLKNNQKLENTVIEVVPELEDTADYSVDLEEYFGNSAAESEYWDLYNLARVGGANLHPNTALGKKIACLIKHKYSS